VLKKKPYNPVLGETFRCSYTQRDGSITTYFAEQVSHHPPVSAFYTENLEHDAYAEGWYAPTSHLYGNSGSSTTEGIMRAIIGSLKEVYEVSWPDVYFRGLLMGSLFIEFCGKTYIKSETTGLISEIEFKAKPFFGGQLNEIETIIRDLKDNKRGNLWQLEGYFDKKNLC